MYIYISIHWSSNIDTIPQDFESMNKLPILKTNLSQIWPEAANLLPIEISSHCRNHPRFSKHFVQIGSLQGSLLLVGPLFHFPQYHSGLESSRNEHVCLCHSITRAGSWYKYIENICILTTTLLPNRLTWHFWKHIYNGSDSLLR